MVIEKQGIAGGTTNYSGGVIQAAGDKWQKNILNIKMIHQKIMKKNI